ncbi:MAG: pirin family protein [Proteobacteria bacterium]|nr:pirin family protein [Pseudomonadota bacterium]
MTKSTPALRTIEGIYKPPSLHWVGDGFRVAGYFSAIPNAVQKLDPFLLLDYHPPYHYTPTDRPRGVGVHPHRGFETVTFAFQGSVAHHDSTGAGGVIEPGDIQWMTAASGILHKEYHEAQWAKQGGVFHVAQLWVNLPRKHKMSPPRYQAITRAQIPVVPLPNDGGSVRVFAGTFGDVPGPAATHTPMNIYEMQLSAQAQLDLPIEARQNLSLLVMEGAIQLNGQTPAAKHDFVIFENDADAIAVQATEDARLFVLAGEPIGEPVVPYGPFVMNTHAEIRQAFADYSSGKFGHLAD